jgi:hypothetical protein
MNYDERYKLIRKVLNSGEWQHTWHIDISDSSNYPRILEIAEEKRDNAIRLLSEAFSLVEEMKLCVKQIEERRAAELAEQAGTVEQQPQLASAKVSVENEPF